MPRLRYRSAHAGMTSLCVCRSRGAYAHSVVILLVNWSSFFLVCPAPPLRRGMWRSCHIWTIPEPSNTHSAAKLSFFLGPRCAMSCAHSTLESDRLMLCAVLHFTRPHAPHIMGNEYARMPTVPLPLSHGLAAHAHSPCPASREVFISLAVRLFGSGTLPWGAPPFVSRLVKSRN